MQLPKSISAWRNFALAITHQFNSANYTGASVELFLHDCEEDCVVLPYEYAMLPSGTADTVASADSYPSFVSLLVLPLQRQVPYNT